jgi:hypothetical protein
VKTEEQPTITHFFNGHQQPLEEEKEEEAVDDGDGEDGFPMPV